MDSYSSNSKINFMTRDEVRAFDAFAINELGIPGVVLMENAGRACSEAIKARLTGVKTPKVCIFCGTGNNGGDGYVIARHLLNSNFKVNVVICGDDNKVKGDARVNLDILRKFGQPVELLDIETNDLPDRVSALANETDLIVDAVLGTGLRGQLSVPCRRLIESINDLGGVVFAVDIPSGLDCDTGEPLGAAIKAEQTVTFVAVKKGFATSEKARDYTGIVTVASIGIEPECRAYRKWLSGSV